MILIPDSLILSSRQDAQLRRFVGRHGYVVRKSRWRHGSIDNHGGYMLVDPDTGGAVAGVRFDLTGADVVETITALEAV